MHKHRTMTASSLPVIGALFLAWLPFSTATAATYKCIDESGGVTYSQTPCPKNQTTDKLLKSAKKPVRSEDCKFAGAFAQMTFRQMRSGLSTQQLFDRYGGVNNLSQGTRGVINYVYSLKYSTTMRADRIAELTIAKCNAQAFGQVACTDFPAQFQEMIFSCDEEARNEALRLQKLMDPGMNFNRPFYNNSGYGSEEYEARQQERLKEEKIRQQKKEQARIARCKKSVLEDIKKVEDRMSQGYSGSTGDSLTARRRALMKKLKTECK